MPNKPSQRFKVIIESINLLFNAHDFFSMSSESFQEGGAGYNSPAAFAESLGASSSGGSASSFSSGGSGSSGSGSSGSSGGQSSGGHSSGGHSSGGHSSGGHSSGGHSSGGASSFDTRSENTGSSSGAPSGFDQQNVSFTNDFGQGISTQIRTPNSGASAFSSGFGGDFAVAQEMQEISEADSAFKSEYLPPRK